MLDRLAHRLLQRYGCVRSQTACARPNTLGLTARGSGSAQCGRSETPTTLFGEALKQQVEQRLEFYESGAPPKKNLDTMRSVIASLGEAADVAAPMDEDDE